MGRNSWKPFKPTDAQAIAFTGYIDPITNKDLDHLLSRQFELRSGERARVVLRLGRKNGGNRLIRLTLLTEQLPTNLADLTPVDVIKFEVFKGQTAAGKESEERETFWKDLEQGRRTLITLDQLTWLFDFTTEIVADLLNTPDAPTVFSDVGGSGTRYLLREEFLNWQGEIQRKYLAAHNGKTAH